MPFRDRFVTQYLNPLEVEDEFRTLTDLFSDLCSLEELPYLTHGYGCGKGSGLVVLCFLIWTNSRAGREDGASTQAPDDVPSF